MSVKYGITDFFKALYGKRTKAYFNDTFEKPNEERKSADQSQFYMDVERPSFLHGCKIEG